MHGKQEYTSSFLMIIFTSLYFKYIGSSILLHEEMDSMLPFSNSLF